MKKGISILTGIAAAVAFAAAGLWVRTAQLPDRILLTEGSSRTLTLEEPFSAEVEEQEVLQFRGTSLEDVSLTMTSRTAGNTALNVELFGIFPVKQIDVTVCEQRYLYPGGQSIGVMLYTEGALVVGSAFVERADGTKRNPAAEAGLKPGDIITAVNGAPVENAARLAALVNDAADHCLRLSVEREEKQRELLLEAVQDASGVYKLGVWVRDSTAGVGTLTYYDPETNTLAGLGHAITDVDTGSILRVKDGELILSEVTEVVKGTVGAPGELKGYFDPQEELLGTLTANTPCGIFAESTRSVENGLCGALPVALRDELREGEATLYASVDDAGVREYTCVICDISPNAETKNFVVEINDPTLLERTGGIVQGMSGSPIIQDGKLVGAVTHVLVNDPTKGYGIFLENMLAAAG